MILILTVISILAITLVAWLANKVLPFTICPICAGVFLTWMGLVGLYFFGYQIDLVLPAVLMGGSVVGIAYQLEKKLGGMSAGARLFFKVFFIPTGFAAVYGVLKQWWTMSALAFAVLLLVSLLFLLARGMAGAGKKADGIEKEMKDCC